MKKYRIYVDTSVFGGTQDLPFKEASQKFFERVEAGDFILLTSRLVLEELQGAPQSIQNVYSKVPHFCKEVVELNEFALNLASAYVDAGVLGSASYADATHVATATLATADLIVSWNFKHIVNFDRIKKFNGVNALHGYAAIDIRSPQEVVYGYKR